MAERLNIESNIRDWLADNLGFITPGLKLIKKEFYLPDDTGARGFVDLLCEDEYLNFVVIEIKRSDTSARQTISEVLKYHSLIKHNFGARESEIKTIVISTHWNELIRPFSETVHRTTLDITGYQLILNRKGLPDKITKLEPLDAITLSRRFAYWYGLYLFETNEQQNAFNEDFEVYLNKKFSDFVLVSVIGDLTDKRVIYPYGVVVAFQQMTLKELPEIIKTLSKEGSYYLDNLDEFENENQYRRYLEGEMINELDKLDHEYESEACYPQKFNSMQLSENWKIEHIRRYGIFGKDPRYSDELLISELSGLDGNNRNSFFGIAESTQVEKIKEIRKNCRYSLEQSPVWLETIDVIFDELIKEKRKFRVTLHIYNPDSLMVAIYHAVSKKELDYLPAYFMCVDYLEDSLSVLYHGSIKWNLNVPVSTFLEPFPKDDDGAGILRLHIEPDNIQDAKEMSLGYTTAKYEIIGQEFKFQAFFEAEYGKLVNQDEFLFPFVQFAVIYEPQLDTYIKNFNRSYVTIKG